MVTEQEILDKLKSVLEKSFEIDPSRIRPETRLYEDLDIDSIDAVDLLVELKPFIGNKNISAAEFKTVRTVGDLTKTLETIINR
ncbi:MAG: acyl carrier protein [Duodenibacillus sp.]